MQSVHERVCTKSVSKKRKVFDSAKQRADGTDVTYRQIKQAQKKVWTAEKKFPHVTFFFQREIRKGEKVNDIM